MSIASSGLLPTVPALEALLRESVAELAPVERTGPGRPAILPAAALWSALTIGVLVGDLAQVEIWRRLVDETWWYQGQLQISKEAVYHRLDRPGPSPMERFFDAVTAVLLARRAAVPGPVLAPFATEVVALDASTLATVARKLPALRAMPVGDPRLLAGKLTAVFDLRRQLFRTITLRPSGTENERVSAPTAIAALPVGSLILADLGYFGYAWFDALTAQGHFWLSKARTNTSVTPERVLAASGATRDRLVWLGAHPSDRARYLVRMLEFEQAGQRRVYLTNVLDPALLSLADVVALYARRWDIELAFKLAKCDLKLQLLWSAKPGVVAHQLWAVLLIAQLVLAARAEVAERAAVADVMEVSLTLLVRHLPRYALHTRDPIGLFARQGRKLGFIRPSRRLIPRAPTLLPSDYSGTVPDPVPTRSPRYARKP